MRDGDWTTCIVESMLTYRMIVRTRHFMRVREWDHVVGTFPQLAPLREGHR